MNICSSDYWWWTALTIYDEDQPRLLLMNTSSDNWWIPALLIINEDQLWIVLMNTNSVDYWRIPACSDDCGWITSSVDCWWLAALVDCWWIPALLTVDEYQLWWLLKNTSSVIHWWIPTLLQSGGEGCVPCAGPHGGGEWIPPGTNTHLST